MPNCRRLRRRHSRYWKLKPAWKLEAGRQAARWDVGVERPASRRRTALAPVRPSVRWTPDYYPTRSRTATGARRSNTSMILYKCSEWLITVFSVVNRDATSKAKYSTFRAKVKPKAIYIHSRKLYCTVDTAMSRPTNCCICNLGYAKKKYDISHPLPAFLPRDATHSAAFTFLGSW